jgi:hypothetical protein
MSYLEQIKIGWQRWFRLFAVAPACKFGSIICSKEFRYNLIVNLYELGYKNLK